MEKIITDLVEKMIVPRFGTLDYRIQPIWKENNKGGSRTIDGCVVAYFNVKNKKIIPSLLNETKLILKLLGYKDIVNFDLVVIGRE